MLHFKIGDVLPRLICLLILKRLFELELNRILMKPKDKRTIDINDTLVTVSNFKFDYISKSSRLKIMIQKSE